MKLTLLDNIELPVTLIEGIECINLRELIKAMGSTNPPRDLANYHNSEAFAHWFLKDEQGLSIDFPYKKLDTDRKYPSMATKEGLLYFLMYSNSEIALDWKQHIVTVVLPEWEAFKLKEAEKYLELGAMTIEDARSFVSQHGLDPTKSPRFDLEYKLQGYFPSSYCAKELGINHSEFKELVGGYNIPTMRTTRSIERYGKEWCTYHLETCLLLMPH